jgi:branched-subunit amino acid aminotransferase/4-amino-4-deoxychorismate lyase
MQQFATTQIEIDGTAPTAGQLRALALNGYGHFTAMQIRARRVRGLDLHLARLTEGNAELFGAGLDRELVTERILHALGPDTADASVRVYLQQPEPDRAPVMTVTVRPAAQMAESMTLQSVPYQRSIAHIKHLGDFGQHYYGALAARNGFGEALLTGPDGLISEGSITNVGCFDGTAVLWPAAAMLRGVTMQVLQREFDRHGMPSSYHPIRVSDLTGFATVFVTNSRGIAPVTGIDGAPLQADARFMQRLAGLYHGAPWDELR